MENTTNRPARRGAGLPPGGHTQDIHQRGHREASNPSQ